MCAIDLAARRHSERASPPFWRVAGAVDLDFDLGSVSICLQMGGSARGGERSVGATGHELLYNFMVSYQQQNVFGYFWVGCTCDAADKNAIKLACTVSSLIPTPHTR